MPIGAVDGRCRRCRTRSALPRSQSDGVGPLEPDVRDRRRRRPPELVWRTIPTLLFPDSTEWRIQLEPAGDGTTITQSFTVVRAPWLLDRLYARLIPSHQDRDARLAEDLARIGATARQEA